MELIVPNKKYYSSYVEAIKEFYDHKVDTYQYLDVSKYDIFEKIENFRTSKNLPINYVNATYLWLVEGDTFIGEVSIRHKLTSSLLCFGGNIGYGIRWSKWNNGYGTIMLSLALKYAKEVISLNKVLITCNDNNLGSACIIEKNNGLLQDKIINVIDGVEIITRRYWIEIK